MNTDECRHTIRQWWEDLAKFGFKSISPGLNESTLVKAPSQGDPTDLVICDPHWERLDETSYELVDELSCGYRTIRLDNGTILEGTWRKSQFREGRGLVRGGTLLQRKIQAVIGNYKHGVLQGPGKVFLDQEDICLEGHFKDGYLEGPVRGANGRGDLVFVGSFMAGRPHGVAWKSTEGDGFLYGSLDRRGEFSGKFIAYIYSDLTTCLLGEFANGVLIAGREARIRDTHIYHHVAKLRFVEEPLGPLYRFWPSTLDQIRVPALQEDVYERRYVRVDQSRVPGAGDGLFARVAIPKGFTVGFYNGIRVKPGETPPFFSRDYEIYVDWNEKVGHASDYMDLPAECISTQNYRASLGHKINHAFAPNCAWDVINHPVFGRVPRILTLKAIGEGEELTCHYKIDMEEAALRDNLNWYVEQWEKASLDDDKPVEE